MAFWLLFYQGPDHLKELVGEAGCVPEFLARPFGPSIPPVAFNFAWEAVANLAPSVRTIKLRTGLVLDPTGGALGRMMPIFKFGFGGKLGSGKQWWSWITLHDQIRAMTFLMNSKIEGAVNLTAPNPVTNQEFTAALARALKRPAFFPAPAFAIKAALGGFSTEVLGSKKVIPKVLMDNNFEFDYPHLLAALTALVD